MNELNEAIPPAYTEYVGDPELPRRYADALRRIHELEDALGIPLRDGSSVPYLGPYAAECPTDASLKEAPE